jgi:hypothetical protein
MQKTRNRKGWLFFMRKQTLAETCEVTLFEQLDLLEEQNFFIKRPEISNIEGRKMKRETKRGKKIGGKDLIIRKRNGRYESRKRE